MVLALLTGCLHSCLSSAATILAPSLLRPFSNWPSHLSLGFPKGLLPRGIHTIFFLSFLLNMLPSYLKSSHFITAIISGYCVYLYLFVFCLILQIFSTCTSICPKIFPIFSFSKVTSFLSEKFVREVKLQISTVLLAVKGTVYVIKIYSKMFD